MTARSAVLFLIGGVALLSSCANSTGGYKQPTGAVLGAAAGGLVGSKIGGGTGKLAATAGGALLGGILGSEAGASLDRADQAYAATHAPQRTYVPPMMPAPGYYPAPTVQGYSSAPTIPPPNYAPSPARVGYAGSGCRPGSAGGVNGFVCELPDGTWRFLTNP